MQRILWAADGKLNWVGVVGFVVLWIAAQVAGRAASALVRGQPLALDGYDLIFIVMLPLLWLAGAWFFLPERKS